MAKRQRLQDEADVSARTTPKCLLLQLPKDPLQYILKFLDAKTNCGTRRVCSQLTQHLRVSWPPALQYMGIMSIDQHRIVRAGMRKCERLETDSAEIVGVMSEHLKHLHMVYVDGPGSFQLEVEKLLLLTPKLQCLRIDQAVSSSIDDWLRSLTLQNLQDLSFCMEPNHVYKSIAMQDLPTRLRRLYIHLLRSDDGKHVYTFEYWPKVMPKLESLSLILHHAKVKPHPFLTAERFPALVKLRVRQCTIGLTGLGLNEPVASRLQLLDVAKTADYFKMAGGVDPAWLLKYLCMPTNGSIKLQRLKIDAYDCPREMNFRKHFPNLHRLEIKCVIKPEETVEYIQFKDLNNDPRMKVYDIYSMSFERQQIFRDLAVSKGELLVLFS